MHSRAVVAGGLLALVAAAAGATQAEFQRFGLQEGLPQVSVRAVIQDRTGFLWIGTQGGLVRFDSYAFRTFRHRADDPATLRDSAVWALERDGQGGLWVGTNGGLDRFDPRSERFDAARPGAGAEPEWAARPVRALKRDSRGGLWVGTQDGLLVHVAAGGSLADARVARHDPDDDQSLPVGGVLAIAEDGGGDIWVGTESGLAVLDAEGEGGFRRVGRADDTLAAAPGHVEAILEDRSGNLWVGTDAGLCQVRRDRAEAALECGRRAVAAAAALAGEAVSALALDRDGTLWVGTRGGGLGRLASEADGGGFVRYRLDQGDVRSLSDDDVRAIFVDRQGILWVGTWGGGLDRHDPASEVFAVLRHRPGDPHSLSRSTVLSILEDHAGGIWVGTWGGGLNRLVGDPTRLGGARFVSWRHDPRQPHSLASDSPWPMIQDRAGDLWIGTWGGGLERLPAAQLGAAEPRFEHLRHRPGDAASLGSDRIAALLEDSSGRIWVGTWGGGLQRVRLGPEREVLGFVTHRHDPRRPHSLGGDFVKALSQDSRGDLWIGTWTGGVGRLAAAELDATQPGFVTYRPDPSDPGAGPNHEHVLSIHEDRRGRIWIGAYGGGLNQYDPRSGRFRAFLHDERPGEEVVYGILEDDTGSLWLSTNGGLVRFEPASGTFLHWDHRDGLAGDEFNQGAYLRSADGRLWFGGVEGLTVFDPARLGVTEPAPPMVVTDFLLFNESVPVGRSPALAAAAEWTDRIVLGPADDVLGFEFAVLDFRRSHRVRYSYRLDGFDRDWLPVSTAMRRASYTRVPPGEYLFRARATVEDHSWPQREVSVHLVVLPPWWRTRPFEVTALLAALLALVGLHRGRLSYLRREGRRLEEQVRQRTAEIADKNQLLEAQARRLDEMARTDPLTGLGNRRDFLERAEEELRRARRHGWPLCIVLADLDRFKEVNDRFGHECGDLVLVNVAETVLAAVRQHDIVGRWGGEELILLLPETDLDGGVQLAERVRAMVASRTTVDSGGASVVVTLTLGVAEDRGRTDLDTIVADADVALYHGKATGRNRVVAYPPAADDIPPSHE